MKIISDLKILEFIYKTYYEEYRSFTRENKTRSTKIYMPIHISKIAKHFNIDDDIIFGRLYYYLDNKYGYKQEDGRMVPFFSKVAGDDKHCVHFPLLASVLADLQENQKRFRNTTIITIWAAMATVAATILASLI